MNEPNNEPLGIAGNIRRALTWQNVAIAVGAVIVVVAILFAFGVLPP